MKWSWRIARISGIDIYLHGSFLILLAWVALSHLLDGHGVTETMAGLLSPSSADTDMRSRASKGLKAARQDARAY